MKMVKRFFKYIFYSFLIFLVGLCCYVFVSLDILNKDYTNIFGYTYFVIASGSMSGEIEVNDIVLVKITKNVRENEIIAFKDGKSVITHRLIKKNGGRLITKGDANDTYDEEITLSRVIGKIVWIISPKFILESIVLVFIIIIVLALLNFDVLFKKIFHKKEKQQPEIKRDFVEVLPQDIFCSPKERETFDEHSGLTITIPLDELKKLKEIQQKEIEEDENIEQLEDYDVPVIVITEDEIEYRKNRDIKEQDAYNAVDIVLKTKNGTLDTTHLNKEWQEKYKYIYKLCLILQSENYKQLDKEIKNVPFEEYYDYDIDKVGLFKDVRNQIYELPIYAFIKILFYATLYNDSKFFDGVYKILKYKVLIDKHNTFVVVKEKYDKKKLKDLILFMERVSKKYQKDDNFDLEKVKKLYKISNY